MATIKQNTLAINLSGKVRSLRQAAIQSGYSKSYADTGRITKTDSWKDLIEEYFPEEKLAEVHAGLLKDKNWRARDAALDKAYKIRGKYAPAKVQIVDQYLDWSDEKLNAEIKRLEEKKNITNVEGPTEN